MPRRIRICTSPETPTCEVPSNGVVEISLLPVCTGETSLFRLDPVTQKPHTALQAKKWSRFTCKRASEDTTLSH